MTICELTGSPPADWSPMRYSIETAGEALHHPSPAMTTFPLTWYVRRSGAQPACVASFVDYHEAMNKAKALNAETDKREWFVSDKPGLAS